MRILLCCKTTSPQRENDLSGGVYHSEKDPAQGRGGGIDLQHHPYDFNIAQFFIQGFYLLNVGCIDGNRD